VFDEQYAVVFQLLLYFWHRSRPLLLTLHAQQTHQHPANTSQPSYFLQHYQKLLVFSVGDVCLFLAANAGSNGGISGATHGQLATHSLGSPTAALHVPNHVGTRRAREIALDKDNAWHHTPRFFPREPARAQRNFLLTTG